MYIEDLLLLIPIAITLIAQIYVNSSYSKYKKVGNTKGISGFEVARQILDNNGLSDVYVTETKGMLSDHYDPSRKVVRLSTDIFHGTSIASTSVAAHEVGHAIQDKVGYAFMKFRAALFPFVNISSYAGYISILIGVLFSSLELIWIGIALEVVILLFQLITLPVEFDASRRAKQEIKKEGFLTKAELEGSNAMLKAAAYTYVAAVIANIMQILRLVLMYGGNRRD